jgi:hypothetical protein
MANSKISALTSATTPLAGTETLPIVQSSTTKKVAVSDLTAGRSISATSLGLGVASPATVLDVQAASAAVRVTSTTGTNQVFTRYGNTGGFLYTGIDTSAGGFLTGVAYSPFIWSSVNSAMLLATNNNECLRLETNADVKVSTGNLVQGTAAKGINFTANTPAAGMTSQLLNWYEEGTWTPSLLYQDPTGLTITYANQNGYYTRVGRQVTAHAYIKVTLVGTPVTDNVNVNGFPFTSLNSTNSYATGNIIVGSAASGSSATQKFSLLMGPNVTYALITDCKGSGNQGSAIGVGVNVVITATISYFV